MSKHIVKDNKVKKVASQYVVVDNELKRIKQEYVVQLDKGVKVLRKIFDDRASQIKDVIYSVEYYNVEFNGSDGYSTNSDSTTSNGDMSEVLYAFKLNGEYLKVKKNDELIIKGTITLVDDKESSGRTFISAMVSSKILSVSSIENETLDYTNIVGEVIETITLTKNYDNLEFEFKYTVEEDYDDKYLFVFFRTEIGSGWFDVVPKITLCGVNLLKTEK
jgi:hypothetical protein